MDNVHIVAQRKPREGGGFFRSKNCKIFVLFNIALIFICTFFYSITY